ncbi:MAG: hypothetical protein HOP13_12320 [Alphaproteobacteria bacterium]|nr:hypothetical protein [Alphaproteobacteria bacterium]
MTPNADVLQQALHLLQTGEAERVLDTLLQQSPGNADALALLGLSFAQRDDNLRAADLLAKALTLKPNRFRG